MNIYRSATVTHIGIRTDTHRKPYRQVCIESEYVQRLIYNEI